MVRVGAEIVPHCLKWGQPIEATAGTSQDDLRDLVQLTLTTHRAERPILESMLKPDDDDYPLWDGINRV